MNSLKAILFLIIVAAGIWINNQASINDRAAAALESALKESETIFSSSK